MHSSRLQIICDTEFSEILMAEVAEAGFDTFIETEKGFEAYVVAISLTNSNWHISRKNMRT